ncbi:MAG: hypothetical protein ACREEM_30450 [Blastocatellia bacterium]
MNPDRWQQVGQFYHAALELEPDARAAFLDEGCGNDGELRREIESLLRAHQQADGFIAGKVAGAVAEMAGQQQNPSLVGRSLGHYQVLSLIGVGGMGQVFLAEDTRLGRKVAVTLLPSEFTQDAERVRRFEREARAAGARRRSRQVPAQIPGGFPTASALRSSPGARAGPAFGLSP